MREKGRSMIPDDERKSMSLTIRVSKRELKEIRQFASLLGLSVADAIRTVAHAYVSGDGAGIIDQEQMDDLSNYIECRDELKELKAKVKLAKEILSEAL